MLWAATVVMLLFVLLGITGVYLTCGRRRVPDYRDEGALLRKGYGTLREPVRQGQAFLAALPQKPVDIESDEELTLFGLQLTQTKPRGTVLLFHGRDSSWQLDFSGALGFLYRRGFQLFLVDERAHGKSRGFFSTLGVWERFDVRAWVHFISERFGPQHPILLMGRQMGASAVLLAAGLELPGNVRGIVADCPYPTPYAYLQNLLRPHIPFSPEPLLAVLGVFTNMLAGFGLRDASVLEAVKTASCPILLLHGGTDLPETFTEEIAAACPAGTMCLSPEESGDGVRNISEDSTLSQTLALFLERTL